MTSYYNYLENIFKLTILMGHLLYSGSDRFKVLDLLDNVPEELWTEARDLIQETGIKTIPKKKKCKKAKWLSEEASQICEKKRSKRQRRKGKIYPFECKVPKNSKER